MIMTKKEILEAVDQLLEGQAVIIDDYKVKAVDVTVNRISCLRCQFFYSCTKNMYEVCTSLVLCNGRFYILEPVDNDNENENRI